MEALLNRQATDVMGAMNVLDEATPFHDLEWSDLNPNDRYPTYQLRDECRIPTYLVPGQGRRPRYSVHDFEHRYHTQPGRLVYFHDEEVAARRVRAAPPP